MYNLTFNIGASRDAIRKAIDQLEDPTEMFDQIGGYMITATRKRFVDGVAPDGSKWAAKKASTLDRYKRLGYGNLARPLTGPSKQLSRNIQTFASKGGVTIGSALIYSGVMQGGAAKGAFGKDQRGRPIPWGRIPARPWLGISKADEVAIVEIAEEHVGDGLD